MFKIFQLTNVHYIIKVLSWSNYLQILWLMPTNLLRYVLLQVGRQKYGVWFIRSNILFNAIHLPSSGFPLYISNILNIHYNFKYKPHFLGEGLVLKEIILFRLVKCVWQ